MAKIGKVLFMGSKKLGLRCLAAMHELDPGSLMGIVTFDDREDTRSAYAEFQAFASETGIKFFAAKNRKEAEEVVQKLRPELCMVVGWYWLISNDTLAVVPNGFLGIHNSLLPAYRGGSPLIWPIINGEDQVGFSLFSFTEGMDEGDLWGQRAVTVEATDYISDILEKLGDEAVSLLKEKYLGILNKTVKPIPQDHSQATYSAARFAIDGLIDWNKSAREIYNFIRAQSEPYPGAFTFYNGRKLIIWRAHPVDLVYYGTPGQVARVTPEGVHVICGDHKPIVLETAQLEPGATQPAREVVKSIKARFSSLTVDKQQLLHLFEQPEVRAVLIEIIHEWYIQQKIQALESIDAASRTENQTDVPTGVAGR
jgi:methionyl-tRNA formyltransferase